MHGTLGKAHLLPAQDENENEMEFGEFTGSFCHVTFCPPSKRRFNTGNVETAGAVEGAGVKGGQAFKEKGPAGTTGNQSYWLISVSQQRTPGVWAKCGTFPSAGAYEPVLWGCQRRMTPASSCLPKLIGLILLGQLEHCGQESLGNAIVLHRAPDTGESLE